jgi:hypothetical protein
LYAKNKKIFLFLKEPPPLQQRPKYKPREKYKLLLSKKTYQVMSKLFFLSFVLCTLVGCQKAINSTPPPASQNNTPIGQGNVNAIMPNPLDQDESEDDWSLPNWVTPSPNTGIYGCNISNTDTFTTVEEVQLAWKDFEPQEGVFDWTKLQTALNGNKPVWIRFYASDARHVPTWLKQKYPNIKTVHWRWPDQPYTDIYGWTGQNSPGNFYPMWDINIETEWRTVMQNFASKGFAKNKNLAFVYFPHGWRWNEFSLKWVPEMIKDGFSPSAYADWFKRTTQDYITAMNGQAGKLAYTGAGENEWIEQLAGPAAAYDLWNSTINLNGGNVLSQYTRKMQLGARNGYTEIFNGFASVPDWGLNLQPVGNYRYSVIDESNSLVSDNSLFYGTENEDFADNHWPNTNKYYYVKMANLLMLRMRMKWEVIGTPSIGTNLYSYVKKTMGKQVSNSPDAWVALRQYAIAPNNGSTDKVENIRNFERWLYQREVATDGKTVQTYFANPPQEFKADNGTAYEALSTDRVNGSNYMYFNLDDKFMYNGVNEVAIKVTYLDNFSGSWQLQYDAGGTNLYKAVSQINKNDGKWKTVTFSLTDARFGNGQSGGNDFRIYNGGGSKDIAVRFVRVVKAKP